MKRFLFLLLAGLNAFSLSAQVIFSQDFESGALYPMKAVDQDSLTPNPSVATIAGPTFSVYALSDLNNVVVSTSFFSPVGQADDWLISPPIEVVDSNTFLLWEAYTVDKNYRDGYQVLVSTTNDSISSFTHEVLRVPAELTSWTRRSVSLQTYVGQTIYFAFRNDSYDKFLLYLDNIKVEVLRDNDILLKNVLVEKYNRVDYAVTLKAELENHGVDTLHGFIFQYEFNGEVFRDSITGLNLSTNKTTVIEHSIPLIQDVAGEYWINTILEAPNGQGDEDLSNNESAAHVYFLSEDVPKKVVVEEACGTWCMWCPRGIVYMDSLSNAFPEEVIPVHGHNWDPMSFSEYYEPLNIEVGNLFPSGMMDRRAKEIDPQDFFSALVPVLERISPVQVSPLVSWDEKNRIVTIKATGSSSVSTRTNDFQFGGIITEDGVTGTEPDYAQVNAYSGGVNGTMGGFENLTDPVPADQMVYNYVARALLGGFDGAENSVPDSLEAYDAFEFEFNYIVPEEYDEGQMHAIVFILDQETGEILNSDKIRFTEATSTPVLSHAAEVITFPNPTTELLTIQVHTETTKELNVNIYNLDGRLALMLGRWQLEPGTQSKTISVSHFSSGQYVLEVREKNTITAVPFTKM